MAKGRKQAAQKKNILASEQRKHEEKSSKTSTRQETWQEAVEQECLEAMERHVRKVER